MEIDKILVIGSSGQIGTELILKLREQYGSNNVIAADIKKPQPTHLDEGPFEIADVTDGNSLNAIVIKHKITHIYLLAALLSASAEQKPQLAWELNIQGLFNVLNLAREKKIKRIFWPSSIAVFGPSSPKDDTPQNTIMDPDTVYGISKLAGERWCEYYFKKYGVDVRSLRYPGIISWKTPPGGGTTDYAVEIYHEALKKRSYTCFLAEDTTLPMIYMDDAINATLQLMNADTAQVKIRSAYNLAAMSFSPKDISLEIKNHIPDFQIYYKPDFRQQIAAGWPKTIDDSIAREQWEWKPEFDLKSTTAIMLNNIK